MRRARPSPGRLRSYISGGMSCSSALTTKSMRSPSSVTWRSTWMLPWLSVTTSTPGCFRSKAAASSLERHDEAAGVDELDLPLVASRSRQTRAARQRRTASATAARAAATPAPSRRRATASPPASPTSRARRCVRCPPASEPRSDPGRRAAAGSTRRAARRRRPWPTSTTLSLPAMSRESIVTTLPPAVSMTMS